MRTENDPGGAQWEALESMLFDAHPYGTPVVGWPGDLSRLTAEDAMKYFKAGHRYRLVVTAHNGGTCGAKGAHNAASPGFKVVQLD